MDTDICTRVAELPDPYTTDTNCTRMVACRKSKEHRASKREERRKHYDPSVEVYWTEKDELHVIRA